ncbi:MAG: exo-alpha-sialidase [candidate division Zixibacteria bacterium]|nr:exo-alpha-sialidase [candidate division Zixibacteria bacterium]
MKYEIIAEGFVTRRSESGPTSVAACSRCAITEDGEIVCTYAVQETLGQNDFKQMLSRSRDGGITWEEQGFLWSHLHDRYSLIGSISRALDGELFLYGIRIPIDIPGESFWSEATQGMKQNTLFIASSRDGGRVWTDPHPVVLPAPGSAEAPGPLTITRSGAWICCYAPYNTFDPQVVVDKNRVVYMRSEDRGKTWTSGAALRFPETDSNAAEAWVIELADKRLVSTCWHISNREGVDYPNAYAVSHDDGKTWSATGSTDTLGQSTGLATLPDGRVLFVYNQRRHGKPGVRMAVADPDERGFHTVFDDLIWRAASRTQGNTSGEHTEWTDFSFGEPSVLPLPDGTLLATLWVVQPEGRGIRYVKLKIS